MEAAGYDTDYETLPIRLQCKGPPACGVVGLSPTAQDQADQRVAELAPNRIGDRRTYLRDNLGRGRSLVSDDRRDSHTL